MATLCRFVLPTSFSSVEEACVAEFNEYKKRMKEISQQKNAKRLTNSIAGASSNNFESNSQQKTVVRNPEQAREEAKKLVQSGLIKVTAQGKDHGFKRASSSSNSNVDRGNKKLATTPNTSSPAINLQTNPFAGASPTNFRPATTNVQENKRRVVNYDDTDNY